MRAAEGLTLVLSTQRKKTAQTREKIYEKVSEGWNLPLGMSCCSFKAKLCNTQPQVTQLFIHEIRRDHTVGTGPMIYKEKVSQNMTSYFVEARK